MQHVDFLIVGNGVAGTTAAETVKKIRPDASVTILSKEAHPLYSRVLLPHVVKGKTLRERAFLRTREQYEAKGIAVRYGETVVRLRPTEHELETASGGTFRYAKLLIATGGEVIPLATEGASLSGIVPLRTIEDTDAITAGLMAAAAGPEETRAAVAVGAGFLGLEFPPFFEKHGVAGHLVMRGPRYWWRILDEEASGMIEGAMESHGVTIHRNVEVAAFDGDRAVRSVRLTDGTTIDASFVGYGVGLAGAPRFAMDAGITGGEHGIDADDRLRTDAPDVWTAGDCAYFHDVTVGRSHRLGNWLNAQEQGRYAGMAMAGEAKDPFTLVSAYSTQIFGLTISFLGNLTAEQGSVWIRRGSRESGTLSRLHLLHGRLVGAAMLNVMAERSTLTALIKGAVPLEGKEKELGDPAFDLKTFL